MAHAWIQLRLRSGAVVRHRYPLPMFTSVDLAPMPAGEHQPGDLIPIVGARTAQFKATDVVAEDGSFVYEESDPDNRG
jgi:hypothetical protein